MLEALADGTIDVIASGHDPRGPEDKRLPFADAAPGMAGAEVLLATTLGLVRDGVVDLPRAFALLAGNPARLLGLHSGRLAKGAIADIVLFDPGEPWVVNKDLLRSRSKNTPFDESKMQGRVLRTLVAGETVYQYPGERN